MRVGIVVLVGLLGVPAGARTADDPVSIDVTPRACVAPCSVRLSVRVVPNAANREITITADSAQFYRSSTRELDPEGPLFHQLVLRDLPSGVYEVRVTVGRAADDDTRRVKHFRVHGDELSLRDERPPV